ncbi:MAG: ABC transporter permease [Bacteroidales bacterium]
MILKLLIRNLLKRPFLNLIKIAGLSFALTGIIFISLLLKYELTYDSFHNNSNRIYRITITKPEFLGGKHFARTHNVSFIPELKEHFAQVENYVRLLPIWGGVIMHNKRYYDIQQAFEADSTFFQVFHADLLTGDKNEVLNNPGSMVITEKIAQKIFGDQNPIGQTLEIPAGQYYGENYKYTVKGIMKDFPKNSHFHPEIIASALNEEYKGWAWAYLLLSENASIDNLQKQFHEFIAGSTEGKYEPLTWQVYLQKITDIHLYSHKLREIEENSDISNVYVLIFAAIILVLISMSNYANLNIGMASYQSKFLYINSILGSSRKTNLSYFLYEGIAITILTLILTIFISILVKRFIHNNFQLDLGSGSGLLFSIIVLSFSLLCVMFSTLPLLKTALTNLKTNSKFGSSVEKKVKGMSKTLITAQYLFSIVLIITVLVIAKQTDFALNKGLGVKENNVICLDFVHQNVQKKFELFKEELLKHSSIESVSAMMEPPGGQANDMFPFEMEGYKPDKNSNEYERIGVFPCDYSFPEVFNLKFLSGNTFTETNDENEGSGEYIINESAMRRLGHNEPSLIIGKDFQVLSIVSGVQIPRGKIIGVVEDFHLSTVKNEVEPLVLFKRKDLWIGTFAISHKSGMRENAISDLTKAWNKLFPEYALQYQFVDSMYKKIYKSEILQAKLLSVFTIIALIICSMGLSGSTLIVTRNRVKEIGLRKVNGAKVLDILAMLNAEFIKWVIIAFVVACPLSWYAMTKWLENFAYKTELSWWIFALSGCVTITVVLFTVNWQSWRAANRNPIEALRYE